MDIETVILEEIKRLELILLQLDNSSIDREWAADQIYFLAGGF